MQTNSQLQLAHDFVQYTGQHIFLTGKAGTGKTTFLRNLKEQSPKRMVVVAPTGVAAINAGGVTIHSFFQISFGPQVGLSPDAQKQMRFSKEKINIIRSLDLLVIDEISMVRADLLDAIDGVMRRYRDRSKPFGGVQLLMIGDLQQLAPVVKDDEWNLLRNHYDTVFFFSSKALRESSFVSIELTHVYRQQDEYFIAILNKVRENKLDAATISQLNQRHIQNFNPSDDEGYITLCTHNHQAQRLNEKKLLLLAAKPQHFKAQIEGNFPEYSYPTDADLVLKVGAQVMFVKNDISRDKLFYNGKIGKIMRIEDNVIYVLCPQDSNEIAVSPMRWENIKYTINEQTNEITEKIEGAFTQFPLKTAWAITIHKSQGLTFERAIIDAEASFAHGQVYVALSRCKTLEGMVLSSPISNRSVINDGTVNGFINHLERNQPDEQNLSAAKLAYQQDLLTELFRFTRMRNQIVSINRFVNDNAGAIPELLRNVFASMQESLQTDFFNIADKFQYQIHELLPQQPNVEENSALQERISKAAIYFSTKIESSIMEPILSADLELDNKALRKQLQDAVSRLEDEAKIKLECLRSCTAGFYVKKLLDARAAAVIEKVKPKTEGRKFAEKSNYSEALPHPRLYGILKAWRDAKATELNVVQYMVFSQKALIEMVTYLPTTIAVLKKVNGLGTKKIGLFGDELIEIIQDYCSETGSVGEEGVLQDRSLKKEAKAEKQPKEDTKLVSYNLYILGKTISEIAAIRGLSASTIEGHLAHFVGTGELDIHRFVEQGKLARIITFFEKADSRSVTPAKEALGDDYSFGDIRFTLKYMDHLADANN